MLSVVLKLPLVQVKESVTENEVKIVPGVWEPAMMAKSAPTTVEIKSSTPSMVTMSSSSTTAN